MDRPDFGGRINRWTDGWTDPLIEMLVSDWRSGILEVGLKDGKMDRHTLLWRCKDASTND